MFVPQSTTTNEKQNNSSLFWRNSKKFSQEIFFFFRDLIPSKATVILETGRFDNKEPAVIIRSLSKVMLMMTAEPMLSKRPV